MEPISSTKKANVFGVRLIECRDRLKRWEDRICICPTNNNVRWDSWSVVLSDLFGVQRFQGGAGIILIYRADLFRTTLYYLRVMEDVTFSKRDLRRKNDSFCLILN